MGARAGRMMIAAGMSFGMAAASVSALAPSAEAAASGRPVLSSLSATSGPTHGGTLVTIRGRNLKHVYEVDFGSVGRTGFGIVLHVRRISSHKLQVRSPYYLHNATVNVVVFATNVRPSRATSHARFTYVEPPAISGLSTHAGPLGGTRITIHGSNLRAIRTVTANGVSAYSVHRYSDRTIAATVRAHAAGTVNLAVRTAYGTSANTTADNFRYVARPVITSIGYTDSSIHPTNYSLGISGANLGDVTSVTIGSARARIIDAPRSSSQLYVSVPPHAAGTVDVVATSPGGSSANGPQTHFTYTVDNPDVWGPDGTSVDPFRGIIKDLACPTDNACFAVDTEAFASRIDGVWSAPVTLSEGVSLGALSCPTAQYCVVTGSGGTSFIWSGGTWTSVPSTHATLGEVSCAAPGDCAAIADSGGLARLNGDTWGATAMFAAPILRISCPAVGFCFAATSQGVVYRWDGAGWDDGTQSTVTKRLVDLACSSPTQCVAIDGSGRAATFDGTWHPPILVFDRQTARQIACAAGHCVAINDSRQSAAFDGSAWGPPITLDEDSHAQVIACSSADRCAEGDVSGRVSDFDGTRWSQPQPALPSGGYGSGITCPAVDTCFVTDTDGNVYRHDATALSEPFAATPGDDVVTDVACSTVTFCVVVSSGGGSAVYDGTAWTRIDAPPLVSVSCPSTGMCLAVGKGAAARFDGASWHALPAPPAGTDLSVSCASLTFCAAAGNRTAAVFTGSSWTAGIAVPANYSAYGRGSVACPSVGHCLWVTQYSVAYQFSAGRWSAGVVIQAGSRSPRDISCVSDAYCVVGYDEGVMRVFDGVHWSSTTRVGAAEYTPSGSPLTASIATVACSAPHECSALAGSYGFHTTP